jgi:tetratricopeptide (TPR) repeat protein
LSHLKGTLVALDAIRLLPGSVRRKARFEIHGSFQHASEEFIQQFNTGLKGLEKSVQMCGPYLPGHAAKILHGNGWLIVPSIWWENSPLVIQEAFAAGRPVICSDIGGMAEKVIDGVSGFHFRVNDAADLAARIEHCISQPALWAEMRKNLPQPLSIEEAVDRLIPLYETRNIPIDKPDLWNEYAQVARDRGDLAEAARRWESMRFQIPNHPVGYAHGLATLRELGRLEEAEALCELALTLFPDEPGFWNERAMIASDRRDFKLAARRWQEMLSRFPDLPEAYTRTAMILRDIGQEEEAYEIMKVGVSRFPDSPDIVIQNAWSLYLRPDWQNEHPGCWDDVRLRFPNHPEGYSMSCNALMRIGHLDQAEVLSEQAAKLFPTDFGVLLNRADCATRRRDWPEAVRRWKEIQALYPEADGVSAGIDVLRNTIQLEEDEQGDLETRSARLLDSLAPGVTERVSSDAEASAVVDRKRALEHLDLFSRFESLGGTCEFGIVQRIGGAHTLGLLRWCEMVPKQLIAALESRFEGVGSLEHTFLSVNEFGEYILHDRRYFRKHTFTFVEDKQNNADKVLRRMCHWLVLLKDKLIEDLGKAEKVFVYRSPGPILEDEVMEIWHATRRYAANTVLCAHLQDDLHPAGTVERIADGLLLGYVNRPTSMDRDGIDFDCWSSVCRSAAELAGFHKS